MCLAVPGEVKSINDNIAEVDINGVTQEARLDTISDDVEVGDYLLVHTGYAIQKMSPEDAEETLDLFDELIEAEEELREESEV